MAYRVASQLLAKSENLVPYGPYASPFMWCVAAKLQPETLADQLV
jgi:hypothetical protein